MNLNQNLMTENAKTPRLGVVPQVDLLKDLPRKPDYSVDSWFAIGRVETEGHIINYLFHIMAMNMPIPIPSKAKQWQVCLSVMDETTGYYFATDHIYKEKDVVANEDNFYLEMPGAHMSGDWDNMKLHLKEGDFEIDTVATAIHYPIFTRGSAVFDIFGMMIHQFSVPYMKTTGTIKVQNKTYQLDGENATTWFDRQWQAQNFKITTEWSWMAIYLDNGEIISVLDSVGKTVTPIFMSVLKTDGSLEHSTNLPPFSAGEKRHWKSEASGQSYATLWELKFPDFDGALCIEPVIEKQEIKSEMNKLSKYEGSAKVSGTWRGVPTKGRATVEIIKI